MLIHGHIVKLYVFRYVQGLCMLTLVNYVLVLLPYG